MNQMIPCELETHRQWIVWRSERRPGRDKPSKVPYTPGTRRRAKSTAPATWRTFEEATRACQRDGFDGVGYVFTAADGFTGVDLDGCCGAYGVLASWALRIVRALDSYTEWSPSGRGVHVIVRGRLPAGGRRKGHVEMYDRARYFTMTGDWVPVTPRAIAEREAALETLHARLFPRRERRARGQTAPTTPDVPDDAALIERARRAKNGARFSALWRGDYAHYPSQSEADLALCNYLAFWTGGDVERMDRLFRQSGLYRPKWDARHYANGQTYGQATVLRAIQEEPKKEVIDR